MLDTSRRLYKSNLTRWYILKTFWRHLCKISWRHLKDVFKTSWRRPEDVLKTFWHVLKTSWRGRENVLKMSWKRLDDVLAQHFLRRLEESWKRLEDALKTYGQDENIGPDQDVFWRRITKANIFVLIKTSWNGLEDVFWRRRRKTPLRRLLREECLLD